MRVAAGVDDVFWPGVQALAAALPEHAQTFLAKGCHTDPFFLQQEPPSVQFLAEHLS